MILMLADCFCWSGGLRVPVLAYDLTAGCPLGQAEDFVEFALVAVSSVVMRRALGRPPVEG